MADAREVMAEAAGYLALVTRTNPQGSADALLRRPDVDATLREALEEARQSALDEVTGQWYASGAGDTEMLGHLTADVDRTFGDLAHLHGLVRHAHASVPQRRFTPGVTRPGEHPSQRSAEERAAAVRDALMGWARKAALRTRMTVRMAEGAGQTEAVLVGALAREAGGEHLMKRWRAHVNSPSCCLWCRRLNGVTIGLRDSFVPYLGGPAAMPQQRARYVATRAGERRYRLPAGAQIIYTHPPRPYRGKLQGPLLHPFCRCRLEIVRTGAAEVPAGSAGDVPQFLSAADVRAMPEDKYESDRAFLEVAVHELDQVLKRLAGGGGG